MARASDLTPAAVARWLAEAQPGARLIYLHAWHAAHGDPAVNDALRAAEARGMLYLVQDRRSRDADGVDYVAVRSSRPWRDTPVLKRRLTMAEEARAEQARRGGRVLA